MKVKVLRNPSPNKKNPTAYVLVEGFGSFEIKWDYGFWNFKSRTKMTKDQVLEFDKALEPISELVRNTSGQNRFVNKLASIRT